MPRQARHERRRGGIALPILLLLLTALFLALGMWQLDRRAWKLRLIAAVETRIHAAPVPAPSPGRPVSADRDAYRRVIVTGTFDHARETRVQAVTERGPGWWLLTPLRTPAGWTVLVNRGFLPADPVPIARPSDATVTGLLRLSEPGGGFLRANDPAADRWYSRDTATIARTKRLGPVAPYFIDAEAGGPGYPIGGLTVVRFRNTHLIYALTWFALAGLSLWGCWTVRHHPRHPRESGDPAALRR